MILIADGVMHMLWCVRMVGVGNYALSHALSLLRHPRTDRSSNGDLPRVVVTSPPVGGSGSA